MIRVLSIIYVRICRFFQKVDRVLNRNYRLSKIDHGENCIIRGKGQFEGNIHLGNGVIIGVNALFLSTDAHIYIGNKVIFGPRVSIITGNHQIDQIGVFIADEVPKTKKCDADVVIEDDVWIGANAIILKGVTIGRGSVIGAGSVVTKSVAPYTVNAGNPCRFIKERFTPEEIEKHESILYGKGE